MYHRVAYGRGTEIVGQGELPSAPTRYPWHKKEHTNDHL